MNEKRLNPDIRYPDEVEDILAACPDYTLATDR
jgi:hypothetical protein